MSTSEVVKEPRVETPNFVEPGWSQKGAGFILSSDQGRTFLTIEELQQLTEWVNAGGMDDC